MKKFLLPLFLLIASFGFGQAFPQSIKYSNQFTATGTSPIFGVVNGTNTLRLSWVPVGTVSTCSITVDSSADGSSFTTGGAIAAQTCTSGGSSVIGNLNSSAIQVNLGTLTGGGSLQVSLQGYAGPDDPCANPYVPKLSKPVADIAASVKLIAGAAGQKIYPCQLVVSLTGTNPTIKIVQGTGAVCAGGTVASLTGDYAPSATVGMVNLGGATQTFVQQTVTGQDLCLFTGGTVTSGAGVLTYAIQ